MTSTGLSTPLHSRDELPTVGSIAFSITTQAGPVVLSSLALFMTEVMNTVFIGQYGDTNQLAAVGLGNVMLNACGVIVGTGLAGAIGTLSSQAHGAGEDKLACIYMQRGRFITTVQLVWMWPVLAYCDVWLIAIGQDPEVARLAAEYNRASAPFLLVLFQNACMRRLFSAFLRPNGIMTISVIVAVLHIGWVYLFVGHLQLGNTGLGLANGMSWSVRFILFTCHWWKLAPDLGLQRRWVLGFQAESLRGWRDYLKIALPSLVQHASEWWFWEICSLVVGYLGATALAAHVAAIQFATLPKMIPMSIGAGTSTLVGNAIGASLPAKARRTSAVSVLLVLVVWTFVSLGVVFCPACISAIFTKDEQVRHIMNGLLLIFAVYGLFDATQNCMGSILGGLGDLKVPSITNLISFYLVMLPLAILLAFPCGLGVNGVWLSMAVGTGLATVVFAYVLSKKDYDELVRQAQERICKK